MNYFGAPLLAANYIAEKDIDRWEQYIYRKMFLVPFDVKGEAITNLCRKSNPAREVLSRTARNIQLRANGQSTLKNFNFEKT